MLNQIISLKNKSDFFLRQIFCFAVPIDADEGPHDLAVALQSELEEFLRLFDWNKFSESKLKVTKDIVMADVGTRTFAFGPTLNRFFTEMGFAPEIHGVEIDAFRRFTNFKSRADYGRYYAKKMPRGFYHPMDFLNWEKSLDIIFLLNPFVTKEPLLKWGLPLNKFQPQKIFDHCFRQLRSSQGVMIASSPNSEEFNLVLEHAKRAGFIVLEERVWKSRFDTTQKQDRYGVFLKTP